MSVRYRYLRPIENDPQRYGEVRTSLHGGICFRLQRFEDRQLLTYSVRPMTSEFKKDLARRITDERAKSMFGFWVPHEVSDVEEIVLTLHKHPVPAVEDQTVVLYFAIDVVMMLEIVSEIYVKIRRTQALTNLQLDVLSAIHIGDLYEV